MKTTLSREQKRHALSIARMDDWDDAWGATMSHWFGLAEVLYHAGTDMPDHWAYRHNGGDLCNPIACYHSPSTAYAGEVLHRYSNRLVRAGKDY